MFFSHIGDRHGRKPALVATLMLTECADLIGRRPILLTGAVFAALNAFSFFWPVGTEIEPIIWIAMFLAQGLSVGLMFGVQGVVLWELFATRTRYSGAAVSREIASVVFGGFSRSSRSAWSRARVAYIGPSRST